MVAPLIIRAVGTYLLKKSAKKQLKKDLAQAKRKPEKKLKHTNSLADVDRFTKKSIKAYTWKEGNRNLSKQYKKDTGYSFNTSQPKGIPLKQSPFSRLTSTTKKQQASNILGPAGTYKSPTKRFNQKDIEMAVSNAMKKAKELKGIK